ncbi:MAG: glycosyltransferase [Thermoleophilia bacterium]|nr:glycosyltransferase [Thermoleophilia bacterium]
MRIALYYPWIYLRSGIERMMLELVSRSRHDWVIFTSHYNPDQTYPEFRKLPVVELSRVPVDRGYFPVGKAAMTIFREKINLKDFDALVVSSEGLGDFITFRNHDVPVICYCHTPLKVIHDHFARRRYLNENKRMKIPFFLYAGVFRAADWLAWRNYQYIFCNSQEVRRRILKAGLAPEGKIDVLSPGLDTSVMQPTWNYQKYFMVVGRIKWWKNLELALQSFIEFKRRYPRFAEFKLIIAGQVDRKSEAYLRKLKRIAAGRDDIIFRRDPAEEELMEIYRNGYSLMFPSLNEDWGMTLLEAMGFGKPVISVNQGGPVESVIDSETGYLVEAAPGAFADAMALLAEDQNLTRKLGEAAALHVQKYDWEHFVDRFDSYLSSLGPRQAP